MGLIENAKTYTGRDLETIFFRPMFAGENAEQLGIHTIYNMPVPTTIQMWSPRTDILKEYSAGWTGGDSAVRQQKTIELFKVKAEVGFSASDYFNQVYELITNNATVSLDDLTGSELEKAETEMFRAAIAESLRTQMWIGDTDANIYNLFDGFIKLVSKYGCKEVDLSDIGWQKEEVANIFAKMWEAADTRLRALKKDPINPMIGAAGISAFPMSGRIVHKMGLAEDPQNHLLMHSIGVNVSGQIASVIAGGIILSMFGG